MAVGDVRRRNSVRFDVDGTGPADYVLRNEYRQPRTSLRQARQHRIGGYTAGMLGNSGHLPPNDVEIVALLREHGVSPTTQRVEIARILLARPQHLSADQVSAQLARTGVSVSKATVYNTLGLFAERRLVRQVIVDASKVFYDSNMSPHHHFYNIDDGRLTDVAISDFNIDELPAPPPGTSAESVDIVIRTRNRAKLIDNSLRHIRTH